MSSDEKLKTGLKRRDLGDRPRDDIRVEIDILLNIAVKQLLILRYLVQVLNKIEENTRP